MVAILTIAAPTGAEAQRAADVAALNKQAVQLYGQGKYKEAAAIAEKALALAERVLGREHPDTLTSVNNLAEDYNAQGRYGEAEPLYKRALEAYERVLGREHPNTLTSVNNLAGLYHAQGRYSEAEPLYKRALAASERVLGPDHPNTLTSVSSLGVLYQARGRYGEAEPLLERALAGYERVLGPEHPDTLTGLSNLGMLYEARGRYSEAEPLLKRALDAEERVLGPEHPDTQISVNNLGFLYEAEGRYSEAEPLYKRALAGWERVLGPEHSYTLRSVSNLGFLYQAQGRYSKAEPLFKRALAAWERVLGPEHPDTLAGLSNLASLYEVQGRYSEAEPLFKRALDAAERVLGPDHPYTLGSVNNLATLFQAQGRYSEAEPLLKRTLAARERVLGPDHPDTLGSVNNLADLYHYQGRYSEAEPLFKRALAASERVLGPEHPDTLGSVHNLATLFQAQGRYSEAEPLFQRALEAKERVLGSQHPDTITGLSNLAALYYVQRDWTRAAQFLRRSTAAIAGRTQRGALDTGEAVTGKKKSEAEQSDWQFWGLVKAVYRLLREGGTQDALASAEMFQTAQWAAGSEAAQSLAQMAARGATGDPALALLARERQDKLAEWQKRDGLRNTWLGQAPDKRDAKAEAENNASLATIDARITEIDKKLAADFPDYAALASPAPLSVEDVQAQLRPDEALVLFLDTPEWKPTPEETFIWVVTKTSVRWVRSDLGTPALTREVMALRCGLDAAAWDGPRCAELTGQSYTMDDRNAGKPLPFDHARAYKLYQALFGQVEDLIKGKSLLIVPSGPLTQLPFQVLVTAPPKSGDHRSAAWLARDHALTVLPAVSSLKALRRVARPSAATKPMIGFGNPLLDGDPAKYPGDGRDAQIARTYKSCPIPASQRVASNKTSHKGVAPLATRGGLASVSQIRIQAPLPDTAIELCDVARDVHADPAGIYLGARATELEVKDLSKSGQLAQYRIVHFATHGALAGQVSGSNEPGLILTPPDAPSEGDDGYLTASEIAGLKLDADWVILSACNTAAGGAQGAEALSGLARAFIYAQARALLVSHWAVKSGATVKLVTSAMRRLAADKTMGRAEAMRQSMLALIDSGTPREAHPAYWAPFVVVGEGAAVQ
jgi:CHAT domain-containing protein/tetratricopeptide (TPR) repeat protein